MCFFSPFFKIGNTSIKGPQMCAEKFGPHAFIERTDEGVLHEFLLFHPLKKCNLIVFCTPHSAVWQSA